MVTFMLKAALPFFLSLLHVDARSWQDVVDRSIYLQPQLDSDRFQLKIELDPFFKPQEATVVSPTPEPVANTWVAASAAPTEVPTAMPSNLPSLSPTAITAAPTLRSENVDGNGGCREGTLLYRVNMYDAWGDGWDSSTKITITGIEDQDTTVVSGNTITRTHTTQNGDTTVSITSTIEMTSDHPFGTSPAGGDYNYVNALGKIFEGALHKGSHGSSYVCLVPRRCYEAVVYGDDYLDEVSWDIEPVILGSQNQTDIPIIEGKAPADCSFSIPDENGEFFCDAVCSNTLHPKNTQSPAVVDHLTAVDESDSSYTIQLTTRMFDLDEGMRLGQNLQKTRARARGDS